MEKPALKWSRLIRGAASFVAAAAYRLGELVMTIAQGIRRALLAVLMVAFTLPAAPAFSAAKSCLTLSDPKQMQFLQLSLKSAALGGAPGIERASVALRHGRVVEAERWLSLAAGIPDEELLRRPINRPFVNGVLTARETLWELHGCPGYAGQHIRAPS